MSFYIVILCARINARIQAFLCKTENCRNLTRNIKMTCGGSNENVCAVIAVLAVLKTAITARYIRRIYSLICLREVKLTMNYKWWVISFCGLFEEVWECVCKKVRRKNAHGVNLLIFNITNLIFQIRFLRFFRISRIWWLLNFLSILKILTDYW